MGGRMGGAVGEFITIVTGLPRSGTSMMMRMLEAGGLPPLTDGARTADDDNPHGYYELEAVKRTTADPSWLADAPGKAVKVVCVLLQSLPLDRAYRVILMVRDPREIVRSQAAMLERQGKQGVGLTDEQLIGAYERELRKARDLLSKDCFRRVEIDYAGAVAHPVVVAASVNKLLDWSLDENAMAAAVDPALYRQRVAHASPSSPAPPDTT